MTELPAFLDPRIDMITNMIAKETKKADRQIVVYALVLLLVSLLQYVYSIQNDFVWDSATVFREDPTIRDFKYIPDYFREDYYRRMPNEGEQVKRLLYYRPLIKIFHLFEYKAFGTNPLGYNIVNIVLNAAVVVLGFLFIVAATGSSNAAFLAALLYAVNPSRVEAVSWAYSDSYIITAFFSFLSLLLYQRRRYILSYAVFGLAILCHESAILLPAIVFLYEYLIEAGNGPRKFAQAAPFFAIAGAFLIIRRVVAGALPLTDIDPVTLLNTIVVVIKRYVKIFFSSDAPITIYPSELFPQLSQEVVLSYLVVFGLVIAGVSLWIKRKDYLFWYLWFFVWIAITFNIGRFGEYLMADKLLYLASFGLCALIALFVINAGRYRKFAVIAVSVLLVLHAATTFSRTRYWKDNITYFEKAVEFAPRFYYATFMLAEQYASMGRYDEAIVWYEKTANINPRFSYAYCNLGSSYYMKGDEMDAVRAWEKASQADPMNPMPYYNISMVMEKGGDFTKALQYYRKFIDLTPEKSPEMLGKLAALEEKAK